jgi:hypothetical protein
MDRWRARMLLPLLALGLALRVRQYAACPSYWYDEAYLLLNVFERSFGELLGPLRDEQAAPPLFLGLLGGLYRLAGGSEWCMRLPALAASVAGLLAMAPLARRVVGRRGWLWAVAFAALGHHAAAHAGEVKPYALDFLLTECILLVTISCHSFVAKHWPWVALYLLAGLAPWASYPAVFVLAAALVALLLHALRRRDRFRFTWGALAAGLFVLSGLALWLVVVRQQATAGLRDFWAASFVDLSSPGAAVAWTGRCLIELGNYGTREMGLPLVVLAVVGAGSLWRRSPSLCVAVVGPVPLALVASALRVYPLGGRLLFFLVPCVWLLAARGIAAVVGWLPVRVARPTGIVPLVLLGPALLWAGHFLREVTPRCQFREAFAYVAARRAAGDVVWVSHPQVYEVYHGQAPDLSAYSSPEAVERAARSRRLWMVCAVAGTRQRYTAADLVARVKAGPYTVLDCRRFRGLEVILYAPRK